ncbi:S-layer homology domain-containing protein [Paenibacillus sp. 19GGS1-52]|uniref:S-layer homology domain-containing protein n=1 Tax=Paenibacillus sp. 19GGS1-52 TaxID=2758563 RepID=UPI001EFB6823|nr:S-layer homology domain-containing protein [Paenibacillus sp. 19GGS1-52]ULO08631.1 S-layer homology domain-containing protein [Paenibacillus sp. 19GGS1-52]
MNLKKKLAASTLAVSMVAASVAGFPFSSKGLAQQFGIVGTASAATSNADVTTKIKKVYAQLTATDATYLYKFKQEVAGISQDTFEEIFAPILNKLKTKVELTPGDVTTSYDLFKSVSSVVYDVYADGTDVIKNTLYIDKNVELLNKIALAANVQDLTFADLNDFLFGTSGVEVELVKLVSSKTLSQLVDIIANPTSQDALLDEAITKVLSLRTGSGALTVSQVVYNLGITSADVKQTFSNLNTEIVAAKPALQALALAYVKAYGLGYVAPTNPGTTGSTTTTTTTTTTAPAIYNVASLVTTVNGVATLKLVDADVLKAFDALVAASTVKTGLTLTLDLGTVTAASVEVPLSQAIIEAAKAKGIANIAVTVNGLTITIPVGQFSAAVKLTVATIADTTVTSVTKLKLASNVYEFDLTVGGVATTKFKQPLTIKLPLKNVDGLDKELLSVAKLVYGDLQFQGGVVDGAFIIEPRDTFSSYAVLENKVTFTDIASVQVWAGRQIQVVAAKGAIEGIGADKFAPKSNVTRAEFAKMLVRALNLENTTATESFSDVSSTAWYAPYVAVAAEKGIITGRSASQFDPNATITRAEMATMISRAVKSVKGLTEATPASALNSFSDASKIAASLKDGVAFAASHNLVIGNAGKFNPNNTATRAEAAVIIYRTINFK